MPTASDTFTYSNGDLATVSSAAWTTLGGNGMTVASNAISQGVLNNDSGCMWNAAFTTTQFSQATISTTGTGTYQDLEVSTRVSGTNYYLASVTNSGTGVEFYLRQGASFTSMGANLAYTGSHVARLESSGNSHTFYVDSVSSRTWTDSTLPSNTGVGIAGFTQAVGNVTLDNWSGGDLGAATVDGYFDPGAQMAPGLLSPRGWLVPTQNSFDDVGVAPLTLVDAPVVAVLAAGPSQTVTGIALTFADRPGAALAAGLPQDVAFGAYYSLSNRKIIAANGSVYMMRTLQSWSLAMNTNSNTDVTTALTDAKNLGFNAVTVWAGGGFAPTGFSGWNRYTNKQGHAYWTGTPWASTFGAAWGDLDWVVSETLRLGLTLNLSFCGGAGTAGARADWIAVTNTNMTTVGTTIANRYPVASNPHIMWHVMWDDASDSTAQSRINALFSGVNGVEGSTARLRWEEPWLSVGSSWAQDGSGAPMPNFVTATWMNGWYSWNDTTTTDAEGSWSETGATTRATGAVEPRYNQNFNTDHQLRATTWSGFIEGAAFMAYGDMDWYPFEAESEISGLGLGAWVNVPGYTPSLQQSYIFPIVDKYIADTTWAPLSSGATFVTTGEGTGGSKAAVGSSNTAILAYFPDARTIVVDTTVMPGTSNVRLRWFDPVANSYTSIATSEAQQTGRSVTLPAARGDGTRDFVLVVDDRLELADTPRAARGAAPGQVLTLGLSLTDRPTAARATGPSQTLTLGLSLVDTAGAARAAGPSQTLTLGLSLVDVPRAASAAGPGQTLTRGLSLTDTAGAARAAGPGQTLTLGLSLVDTAGAARAAGPSQTLGLTGGPPLNLADVPGAARAAGPTQSATLGLTVSDRPAAAMAAGPSQTLDLTGGPPLLLADTPRGARAAGTSQTVTFGLTFVDAPGGARAGVVVQSLTLGLSLADRPGACRAAGVGQSVTLGTGNADVPGAARAGTPGQTVTFGVILTDRPVGARALAAPAAQLNPGIGTPLAVGDRPGPAFARAVLASLLILRTPLAATSDGAVVAATSSGQIAAATSTGGFDP